MEKKLEITRQQNEAALALERAKMKKEKERMQIVVTAMSKVIKLNIGGSKFTSSQSTLTKFPDSMLGAMFSGIAVRGLTCPGRYQLEKDEEGAYFIDRSGKHFEKILAFLRDGELFLPTDPQEIYELKKEAVYYGLDGLSEQL